MNRLRPQDFQPREAPRDRAGRPHPAAGLIITCTADCFPAELLARELAPAAWLIHRTPGNIVPAFGSGHRAEEAFLEWAVEEAGVATAVVCGHHPCDVTAHLLTPDAPAADLLLRDWLSHAEAARRCVLGLAGADAARAAAAHNVLAQLTNLRTHPAVAAALARGGLKLFGWLHAGELLCPGSAPASFDRSVAVRPDQSRHLRRRPARRGAPASLPILGPPYLA